MTCMNPEARKKHRDYMREYYRDNPDQRKKVLARMKKWRKDNPAKTLEGRVRYRARHHKEIDLKAFAKNKKLKLEVIMHYGGICACCGEDCFEFLQIDHINNDGANHRREIGRGSSVIYRWLIRNNYLL